VQSSGGVGHPFWRRASNSVVYQSPVFAGGAQFKFLWQTNQDKTPGTTGNATNSVQTDPQLYSTSIQWAGMGGRARVGAAFDGHKDFTTAGKTDKGWSIKGGYNFGIVDVGVAYEEMTYQAALSECKAKQYAIAAAVPIGQGAIRASYSVAKDIEGTYSSATFNPGAPAGVATRNVTCSINAFNAVTNPTPGDNGAKQYNIGYDHRFSKRTTLGFGYAAIKNDAGAGANQFVWSGMSSTNNGAAVTAPLGTDISVFFVNIVHRF
jgi:predicted porin